MGLCDGGFELPFHVSVLGSEDVAAIRIVSLSSSDDLDTLERSFGSISEGLEGEVEDDN